MFNGQRFAILVMFNIQLSNRTQPSECGRQHTLICVNAETAAWQHSNSQGRGRYPGSLTHSLSLSLPIHVSDTAATSQDGSIFRMQGSEGC